MTGGGGALDSRLYGLCTVGGLDSVASVGWETTVTISEVAVIRVSTPSVTVSSLVDRVPGPFPRVVLSGPDR